MVDSDLFNFIFSVLKVNFVRGHILKYKEEDRLHHKGKSYRYNPDITNENIPSVTAGVVRVNLFLLTFISHS